MKDVKYWLYLAAKLLLGAGVWLGLQAVLYRYPLPPPPLEKFGKPPALFLHDMLFTFLVIAHYMVGAGIVFAIIWDQKRRCRACLRKLIMPLSTGSWGNMVTFGRPRTEWICPYGHGTLSIEELQITGRQAADWQPHDDNIWKELESNYPVRR
ncbi:MAG TPA: hypothetical protein VGG97_08575 [Bryobacteraceae bacterium]